MKGLEVDTAMKWLNVSRSYVYRMLRNDELQAVSNKPLLINPNSIIKKIGHTYPEVSKNCWSILSFSVNQDVKAK